MYWKNKMKLSRKLYLPFVFLIIVSAVYVYSFKTSNNKLQQVRTQDNTVALWNKEITEKYDDEPKYEDDYRKISSSSAWIVPPDPYVVRPLHVPEDENVDMLLKMASRGTSTPVLSDKDIDEIWTNSTLNKDILEKFVKTNKLPEFFSYFFYRETRLPLKFWDEDITGDGFKDQLFSGVGVGCISCHTSFIDIFVKGQGIFQAETNKGTIYSRVDNKGFYLDSYYTGKDYATCCPDKVVVSKYEWNGNGFTEIARKELILKSIK